MCVYIVLEYYSSTQMERKNLCGEIMDRELYWFYYDDCGILGVPI